MEGRTAILRGEVATEHGREVAELMARLEGGVNEVRNEIVVAGSGTMPAARALPQAQRAKPQTEKGTPLTSQPENKTSR